MGIQTRSSNVARLTKREFEALQKVGLLKELYPDAPNKWADLHKRGKTNVHKQSINKL